MTMHGPLNVKLVHFDTSLFIQEFYNKNYFQVTLTFNSISLWYQSNCFWFL